MARVKKSYLLLSIASTAAVVPACGGDVKSHFTDPDDNADGSAKPSTGAGGVKTCGGHVCGIVVNPSGGSTNPSSDAGVHGIVVQPPPASGGTGPCGGQVCGVVVMPSTGGAGGTMGAGGAGGVPPCHPCGVVPIPTGGTMGAGGTALIGSLPVPGGAAGVGGYFPGLVVPPGSGGLNFGTGGTPPGIIVRPPTGGYGGYGAYGGYGNHGGYGSYGGRPLPGLTIAPSTGGHS